GLAKSLSRSETTAGFPFFFERVRCGWYTEQEISPHRPGGTFPGKNRDLGRRQRLVRIHFSKKRGIGSPLCLFLHRQRPWQRLLERKTTRPRYFRNFTEPIMLC